MVSHTYAYKFKRKLGVLLTTAALVLAGYGMATFSPASAFAASTGSNGVSAPANLHLYKDVVTNSDQTAPTNEDFTFQFERINSDGTAATDDAPVLGTATPTGSTTTGTVHITRETANSPASSSTGSITGTSFFPQNGAAAGAADFGHAGEFIYRVTEVAGNGNYTYSTQRYIMRVYITNHTNTAEDPGPSGETTGTSLTYGGIRVWSTTGTTVPASTDVTDAKINPGDNGEFRFVNDTTYSANFTIQKLVTGNQGNRTEQFPITAVITIPSEQTSDITINYQKGTGTSHSVTIPAGSTSVTIDSSSTNPITLAADETVTFTSNTLPNNSTIAVTETSLDGHTASATFHNAQTTTASDVTATSAGVFPAQTLTHGENQTGTTAATGTNAFVLTNDRSGNVPTGIVMNNLPFIALGIIAIVGIAAYGVSRKRRREQE